MDRVTSALRAVATDFGDAVVAWWESFGFSGHAALVL